MRKVVLVFLLGQFSVVAFAQNSKQRQDEIRDSIAQANALKKMISSQNGGTTAPTQSTQPAPVNIQSPQGTRYADEYNVSGKNSMIYIDNNGQQAMAKISTPTAGENPVWSVSLRHVEPTGQFVDYFTYRGENGSNYETRVVTTPSNDPNKRIEVHFESRKVGSQEFKKGRVVVIDWDNNPWLVKVEFSNDKGVYFDYKPYQPENK